MYVLAYSMSYQDRKKDWRWERKLKEFSEKQQLRSFLGNLLKANTAYKHYYESGFRAKEHLFLLPYVDFQVYILTPYEDQEVSKLLQES